jgi:YVTN family beta-propeller protein
MLAPASAVDSSIGPYFGDHVRFVWRERGVRYVATLHTFGDPATTELLGRIVASLVPAARLAPVEEPPGSVIVGPAPTGLAADVTGLWVATAGAVATGLNGQLVRFDRVSLRPSARPRVRAKRIRVAAGEGAVWTVSYDVTRDGQNLAAPELARVDPVTGRVTARLGLGPGEGTGIAVGGGSVWITRDPPDPRSPSVILRVDPGTMRVRTRIRVGRGAASVAVDGPSVWVVNATSNTLSQVNASSGRVTATVPVGHHPFGIAVGSGSVWVTNVADGTVSRVDGRSHRVTATIPVGRAPYGVTTNSHDIWVAVLGTGTLVKIDPNANVIAELVQLPGDPLAIAADGPLLFVTLNTDGLLMRVDPATLPR